jgi:hypothetical protein
LIFQNREYQEIIQELNERLIKKQTKN